MYFIVYLLAFRLQCLNELELSWVEYGDYSMSVVCRRWSGVRTFCPKPVAKVIMNVGGTSSLLGLVAMAADIEGLYASVKALVCVVRSNKLAAKEMDRIKGYQVCIHVSHSCRLKSTNLIRRLSVGL